MVMHMHITALSSLLMAYMKTFNPKYSDLANAIKMIETGLVDDEYFEKMLISTPNLSDWNSYMFDVIIGEHACFFADLYYPFDEEEENVEDENVEEEDEGVS